MSARSESLGPVTKRGALTHLRQEPPRSHTPPPRAATGLASSTNEALATPPTSWSSHAASSRPIRSRLSNSSSLASSGGSRHLSFVDEPPAEGDDTDDDAPTMPYDEVDMSVGSGGDAPVSTFSPPPGHARTLSDVSYESDDDLRFSRRANAGSDSSFDPYVWKDALVGVSRVLGTGTRRVAQTCMMLFLILFIVLAVLTLVVGLSTHQRRRFANGDGFVEGDCRFDSIDVVSTTCCFATSYGGETCSDCFAVRVAFFVIDAPNNATYPKKQEYDSYSTERTAVRVQESLSERYPDHNAPLECFYDVNDADNLYALSAQDIVLFTRVDTKWIASVTILAFLAFLMLVMFLFGYISRDRRK